MSGSTRAPKRLNHEPEAVTYARENAELTKTELAQRCGLSLSLIAEIEAGTRNATPTNLRKLAVALNCPVVVLQSKRPVESPDPVESPEASPYPKRNPMVACEACSQDNDVDSGRTFCTYCGAQLPAPWGNPDREG